MLSEKLLRDFDRGLNFRKEENQRKFDESTVLNNPVSSLLLILVILEVPAGFVHFCLSIINKLPLLYILNSVLRNIGSFLIIYYLKELIKTQRSKDLSRCAILVSLGSVYLILASLWFSIYLILFTIPYECEYYVCRNNDQLRSGQIVGALVGLFVRPILFKSHRPGAVFLSWVITFVGIIVMLFRTNSNGAFDKMPIVVGFVYLFFIQYEYELSVRRLFLSSSRLETTLQENMEMENETRMKEMQTRELKHLIGNVAHDLKSPLHAFGFELDMMIRRVFMASPRGEGQGGGDGNDVVDEENFVMSTGNLKGAVTINGSELKESVDLLKSVCSFMLMTINRAIDYTKASSGISLVPSLETVDLYDTMKWVVKCSKHGKGSSFVVVQPLAGDVCPFVITDKQWLMENLLCLVSNALKFTAEGAISINASLVRAADVIGVREDRPASNSPSSCDHGVSSGASGHISEVGEEKACGDRDEESGLLQVEDIVGVELTARPTLDVDVDREEEFVILMEVVDGGIGISREQQRELFQPFKQAQRRAGGTGLGLFSLWKRVESLGGRCGVSDRLDGQSGCRFWFTLPYRPDVTTSAYGRQKSEMTTATTLSQDGIDPVISKNSSDTDESDLLSVQNDALRKLSLLLVEDSMMIQKTTCRALSVEGLSVDVASNGLECLKCLEKRSYDLVLMDIQMPMMDGLEATRRIRDMEAGGKRASPGPDPSHDNVEDSADTGSGDGGSSNKWRSRLCIIAVSANSDSQSEQEAYAAGVDAYISKPISMKTLKEKISKLGLIS